MQDFINQFSRLSKTPEEQALLSAALNALDEKYRLAHKMARETGTAEIVQQLVGRIFRAYRGFTTLRGQRILDIACGSNTSKAPTDSPFFKGESSVNTSDGYSALFEPWFCRLLLELGAHPVGVDIGDLTGEAFEYYTADLGQPGALDFLPDQSFDAVQDSRLFGSPEFTRQFPDPQERRKIAAEIWRQARRVLKPGGIVIHSDAAVLLR